MTGWQWATIAGAFVLQTWFAVQVITLAVDEVPKFVLAERRWPHRAIWGAAAIVSVIGTVGAVVAGWVLG